MTNLMKQLGERLTLQQKCQETSLLANKVPSCFNPKFEVYFLLKIRLNNYI